MQKDHSILIYLLQSFAAGNNGDSSDLLPRYLMKPTLKKESIPNDAIVAVVVVIVMLVFVPSFGFF